MLRRSLFLEFRAAAEDVRTAIGQESLTEAVHAYRKGLRRARAILRLVAGELPKAERREIHRALTDARRALGSVRDQAVANDVLGSREEPIAKQILATAAAGALAESEIRQLLAEGAARTAAQVELLDAVLLPRLDWSTVVDGLRATYARARRARKAAKKSRHAFHTWRRRCKELLIQLAALAPLTDVAELQQSITDATDGLGHTVDLLMARDFVRLHGRGLDGADLLANELEQELDDRIRDGRRAGRDAFRKKPRRLLRLVALPPPVRGEEFAMT